MTRQMYESLAMPDLRAIAKQRGMKVGVRVKKSELIDMMLEQDEKDAAAQNLAPITADNTVAVTDSTLRSNGNIHLANTHL